MRAILVSLSLALAALFPTASAHAGPSGFPEDFLWGVANSGFQSEGNFPDSNWTRYLAKKADDPYGRSVDFYNRYKQDIALARDLGVKVFRTSVEWARVEPAPGRYDAEALRHYDDVVREIRARGMRPMLTLDHWVYPGWIADRGGWKRDATVDSWLRYAQFMVNRYKGQNVLWITFNELEMYVSMELLRGGLPFGQEKAMTTRLVRAHRRAYDMIHKVDPGAKVSTNVAHTPLVKSTTGFKLLDRVADKIDFIGLDFYFGLSVLDRSIENFALEKPWEIVPQPEALYYVIRNHHRHLPKLPIYIVENGYMTDEGKPAASGYTRSDHLKDHLYWIQKAIADGMPVMGYNYWSLTDDYQWGSYKLRLGLYSVDARNDPALTRRPTDAVATYRSIIAQGLPAGYEPKATKQWCQAEAVLETCFDLDRLKRV